MIYTRPFLQALYLRNMVLRYIYVYFVFHFFLSTRYEPIVARKKDYGKPNLVARAML